MAGAAPQHDVALIEGRPAVAQLDDVIAEDPRRRRGPRAIRSIRRGVRLLARHPEIGRPVDELPPEFREWFIPFGGTGYVALYRFDGALITILALRHAKEAGY